MQKDDFLLKDKKIILNVHKERGMTMKDTRCRCRCRLPERDEWSDELRELGCSDEMIQSFLNLLDDSSLCQAQKLLSRQKQSLLQKLHQTQEQIDHLDFLVYALRQDRQS